MLRDGLDGTAIVVIVISSCQFASIPFASLLNGALQADAVLNLCNASMV